MHPRRAFWAGVLCYSCIISLFQDFMGIERYIKFVNAAWVSAWYTVPLALIGLFATVVLYCAASYDE